MLKVLFIIVSFCGSPIVIVEQSLDIKNTSTAHLMHEPSTKSYEYLDKHKDVPQVHVELATLYKQECSLKEKEWEF